MGVSAAAPRRIAGPALAAGVAIAACTGAGWPPPPAQPARPATATVPAAAPGSPGVSITIGAKSRLAPVTGHVLVIFRDKALSSVRISGSVTGAARGDTVALAAQQFPYTSPPVRLATQPLRPGGYAFRATPGLATRYRVTVSAGSGVLARSRAKYVYLAPRVRVRGLRRCGRPVCRQRLRVREVLPASAFRAESAKRWHVYFGLRLSPIREPRPPRWLYLDHKARVSKVTRIRRISFGRTVSFSFRVGASGYHWLWVFCTRDTVSADGIGLPGHHGCGNHRIRATARYLG